MDLTVRSPQGNIISVIDDEDVDLQEYKWSMAGGKGSRGRYVSRKVRGTTEYLHRVIAHRMGIVAQVAGEGRSTSSVDHINGNKLDNRRANLRIQNRKQQMANTNDGLRTSNRSGYRGVSECRPGWPKPWMAYVQVDGRSKNLGWYATVEEAAAARRDWDERQE